MPAVKNQLQSFRYILWFFVILFGFHLLYSALINDELMIPGLEGAYLFLRKQLFVHSAWVIENLAGIGFTSTGTTMRFDNGTGLLVDESCSAVKWFAHLLVLMLIFPGPWKHKLWFIPAGIVVTHLVNIIRITGLAIVQVHNTEAFGFFHDYIFRPFFYLVLFLMWVAWVEYFYLPQKQVNQV